jgi:hypothetical protein
VSGARTAAGIAAHCRLSIRYQKAAGFGLRLGWWAEIRQMPHVLELALVVGYRPQETVLSSAN